MFAAVEFVNNEAAAVITVAFIFAVVNYAEVANLGHVTQMQQTLLYPYS